MTDAEVKTSVNFDNLGFFNTINISTWTSNILASIENASTTRAIQSRDLTVRPFKDSDWKMLLGAH